METKTENEVGYEQQKPVYEMQGPHSMLFNHGISYCVW